MKHLPARIVIVSATILVAVACSKSNSATPDPCTGGTTQQCFGTAADTCYCSPASTCTYCTALLNANPTNPYTTCDAYRAQGSTCHSTDDCTAANGTNGAQPLVCHTDNDAYVFSCVYDCTSDSQCPQGQSCVSTGGTGMVCQTGCSNVIPSGDDGGSSQEDAPSGEGGSLGTTPLSEFVPTCQTYYAGAAGSPGCSACYLNNTTSSCQDGFSAGCSLTNLNDCQTTCASSSDSSTKCACIASCLGACETVEYNYMGCLDVACQGPCVNG